MDKKEQHAVRICLEKLCKDIVCEEDVVEWYEQWRMTIKQALQEKLERMENGQPPTIESAPNDGTPFLGYSYDEELWVPCILTDDEKIRALTFIDDHNYQPRPMYLVDAGYITHWQPLPPAPKQGDK